MEHTYFVIMAGGSGTRLWPVSRRDHPKHTLSLLGGRSLFQNTVDRLSEVWSTDDILVVTSEEHVEILKEQTPQIPPTNYLLEPEPRGTASVIGLAAAVLAQRDPQAIMVILPADHHIGNRDLFHHILRVAIDVAKKDYLVTLGITPSYPATGYGYIQRGTLLPEKFTYPVYRAVRFKEKPNETDALAMLQSGDYSWNSGMFIWRARAILKEFKRQMPDLYTVLERVASVDQHRGRATVVNHEWPKLKSETIDYGIMENAAQVAVLPASGLGWSDIGNWDSLFDVLIPDKSGNIVFGGVHKAVDTYGSLVYGTGNDRLVVTIGVDDMIIIDNDNVLLVCRKDQAQKVREVVEQLRKENQQKYL